MAQQPDEADMIPWELLGKAPIPGHEGEIRLYRRAGEFSIRVDNYELMNSRAHGSEEALAELAFASIAGRRGACVLIGGLGMGYTLAAALQRLEADGRAVVAEIVPQVVEWNRGPLSDLAGHPLRDARTTVRETDVASLLREGRGAYDAVLLDVDNGPEALTRKDNEWLYTRAGLQAAFAALRPGGVLAIWSAAPHRMFPARLRREGFDVEEVRVRARGAQGGGRHLIWVARRGARTEPTSGPPGRRA